MATFKEVVLEHHKKEDGSYNIKIRVTHQRKSAYLSTSYYVVKNQLKKDFSIKDNTVKDQLIDDIRDYRERILKLGNRINSYTAKELVEYLEKKTGAGEDNQIDFVKFSRQYIAKLQEKDPESRYPEKLQTALNTLIDFFHVDKINIQNITGKVLSEFEEYLSAERTIVRPGNADLKLFETKRKALKKSGIITYMSGLRTLFNAALDHYNDEDKNEILITHYPFRKYKLPKAPKPAKRNLSVEVIKKIRDKEDIVYLGKKGISRPTLGRDIFMLSFYLIGMNTVDLFRIDTFEDGRLGYKRRKTASRRQDEAFISIKVEPEALPLIEKYRDTTGKRVFKFYQMYIKAQEFNRNINKGLKALSELIGLEETVTHYYARHSWATIARNVCRIPKDDIAAALNHADPGHKVTDDYLEKDWGIIDEANRKVLNVLI